MSDRLAEFFLTAPRSVRRLELVEMTHPDFTKPYRVVRNQRRGVTVPVDGVPQDFEWYPMRVKQDASSDDLSEGLSLDFGDLGEVIPKEVDAAELADGMGVRPQLRYWAFRSDDLDEPILGPYEYEVRSVSFTAEGATIKASAPELAKSATGEAYTLERFPMLRGML